MKTRYLLLAALGGGLLSATLLAQPTITLQPTNQTVSVGAYVQFRVLVAPSSGTLSFQWWFKDAALDAALNPSATRNILRLTNVTVNMTEDYWAVVTDDNGSATSDKARLTVDPTFTKITSGPVVNDQGGWDPPIWWDYDNDGWLDLYVPNNGPTPVADGLYHNNGDSTFNRVTTNAIGRRISNSLGGAVGDYNNDGREDLIACRHWNSPEDLFRNDGDGSFLRQSIGTADQSLDAGWADYDRDGFLDLFTANGFDRAVNDCLFRNSGDGTFTQMTANQVGTLVADNRITGPCTWVDYDNDGWPDLWVGTVQRDLSVSGLHFLWHNNRDGTFSQAVAGSLTDSRIRGIGLWADYDNDGYSDMFVPAYVGTNSLYRNLDGKTFADVAEAAGVAHSNGSFPAAWGDYDNDGYLDIIALGYESTGQSVLYHNRRDGTFQSVDVGSPLRDGNYRIGVAWADYDNDGFLDLLITCGDGVQGSRNFLYHNNRNSNAWIKVKLVGTASNRSAIGAKIRAKAVIAGKNIMQTREISGNSGLGGGGGGLIAHFGLGDTASVDLIRIEWPSGIVQELTNVAAKQVLTVTEPTELVALDEGRIWVRCWKGMKYEVEVSNDLAAWTSLGVFTNETGRLEVTDADAAQHPYRFYRAMAR